MTTDAHGSCPAQPAAGPTTGTTAALGFAPGTRLLIINCDDFGMYPGINEAVVEAIESGVASSCSVMVPCPSATAALRLLADRPGIPFGIHLTLVCEMPRLPWGPLAERRRVPSLLDDRGEFHAPTPAGRRALLARARPDEVEREFRAQIDTVVDAGLSPTHLDFHCLADGGRDDILDLTVDLAAHYGLAVRVWLDPGLRSMRRRGLPVIDHDFLDSFSLPTGDRTARYVELLRRLPPGLNEWAVHPGRGDTHAQSVDDGWRVRSADHAFLTSAKAREVLAEEGIVVLDYSAVRRVWAGVLRS